ncbi:MAG: hypothetical protein H7066_17130 [Cytophagaceae bacterium]|nr:hypothetical protein [Gemmatimonadaceae bacterium]
MRDSQSDILSPASRRDFLTHVGLGSLALAASACAPGSTGAVATTPTPAPAATPPAQGTARPGRNAPPIAIPPTSADGPWDHSWIDRLKGARYKLVFDIGAYQNGGGLYYARNYLNGMRDGWQMETPDVIAILGISGDAYPIIFNDAMWEKHAMGASSKTTDSRTGVTAVRNIWWQPRAGESMAEFGVDVLQRRGAQVLFCNNVFRGVIRSIMARTQRPYAEVRAELAANMLPGVVVVPAIVAGMAMAQANGAAYVYAGA